MIILYSIDVDKSYSYGTTWKPKLHKQPYLHIHINIDGIIYRFNKIDVTEFVLLGPVYIYNEKLNHYDMQRSFTNDERTIALQIFNEFIKIKGIKKILKTYYINFIISENLLRGGE